MVGDNVITRASQSRPTGPPTLVDYYWPMKPRDYILVSVIIDFCSGWKIIEVSDDMLFVYTHDDVPTLGG